MTRLRIGVVGADAAGVAVIGSAIGRPDLVDVRLLPDVVHLLLVPGGLARGAAHRRRRIGRAGGGRVDDVGPVARGHVVVGHRVSLLHTSPANDSCIRLAPRGPRAIGLRVRSANARPAPDGRAETFWAPPGRPATPGRPTGRGPSGRAGRRGPCEAAR